MSGTLTYAPGATNPTSPADLAPDNPTTFTMSAADQYILIDVGSADDSLNEEHETFTVTINPGIGYVVGNRPTISITITDNDPPAAPGDLSLRARDTGLRASWSKPDGPVTGYQMRWKETSATDQAATTVGDPSTGWVETDQTSTFLNPVHQVAGGQITSLTNGTSYDVQVRATDGQTETGNGYGPWSASQSETPVQSADADLSALTAESSSDGNTFTTLTLDQTFAPGTTGYTATVAHTVTHARLTPTVSDSNASVQVGKGATLETVGSGTASDAIALEVDDNAITLRVTAQDGTTQDYTVTITRQRSSDATLSALTAESGAGGTFSPLTFSPVFDAATTSYTASVPNTTTHARLTPAVNHSGASVRVGKGTTLSPVSNGTASNAIALDVGDNAIIVRVTAQDSSTREYTVTVTRRNEPRVSLSTRPNPVDEGARVIIEASLSDSAGADVTIPVLIRWGSEFKNGQVTEYGDLDHGDLENSLYVSASTTQDGNGNRYSLWTMPTFVRINSGAHQRTYGLQPIGTHFDADSQDETFTVLLDTENTLWPVEVEPGSPASVMVTIRDVHRLDVPPGPPSNVLVAPRDGRLDLSWRSPSTGGSAADYEVQYTWRSQIQVADNAGYGWTVAPRSGDATWPRLSITGLTNDIRYRVRVRAVNPSGRSAWAFGAGIPQAREYDPHSDPTRATLGTIKVYYDGNPPVDGFGQWQPVSPSNFGYAVRIPGEFSTIDPNDGSVRFTQTTHAKLEVHVGNAGSTLRVGKVTYPGADQSDPQATPPVDCTQRTRVAAIDIVTGSQMTTTYWRCVALRAVAVGELSHTIELSAHSSHTMVDIEVTDGEVVRTWLLDIDPPPRTYSLTPQARVVEGHEAKLTLA